MIIDFVNFNYFSDYYYLRFWSSVHSYKIVWPSINVCSHELL